MIENKDTVPPMTENHELSLKNRNKLFLNGIKEVFSFDNSAVSLQTVQGDLLIEGENLHVNTLDTEGGIVELEGLISALYYTDNEAGQKAEKTGLFSRLFR